MQSNKPVVGHIIDILEKKGVKNIVISPGSRNAPLIISLEGRGSFNCVNVPDERSAAYFALGMSLYTEEPTAIVCSSGTAVANYLPAAAEATYQHIPLLFLTADRPVEWVDQGDGQTIRQQGVLDSHVKRSYQLPQEAETHDELWSAGRIMNEAIDRTMSHPRGPVHVNVPLREPLYDTTDQHEKNAKLITEIRPEAQLSAADLARLSGEFNASKKVMILCGQMSPNPKLAHIIEQLSEEPNVAVVTETTANLWSMRYIPCIDRTISTFDSDEQKSFSPDLLISIGDMIISKKVKAWLRKNKPDNHWHIGHTENHFDVFQSLTDLIQMDPNQFFRQLQPSIERNTDAQYSNEWLQRHYIVQEKHKMFVSNCRWSDMKAFEVLLDFVPDSSVLHMGNSTAVRYVQLYDQVRGISYFSNRGTSGIDGSVSTASGYAWLSDHMNTLITGDISFFYDSNGLWHDNHKGNLKVIVINNGGGGIFRVIDGPASTEQLSKHFETSHERNVSKLAEHFGFHYHTAANAEELESKLIRFYEEEGNSIFEIQTPRDENDVVLKEYFKALR